MKEKIKTVGFVNTARLITQLHVQAGNLKARYMRNQLIAFLALLAAIAALLWHKVDRPPKIAYAETNVLIAEFSEAIKARHEYETFQKDWDTNLKRLNDSLMAAMDMMKHDYDKASVADKKNLEANLNRWNEDYQRYVGAVKKMSEEKEKELMDPVLKKMNSFLDLWGKQNGYGIIFGTLSGGNILQADAAYNVTSQVLKDLNEQYRDLPLAKQPITETKTGTQSTDTSSRNVK